MSLCPSLLTIVTVPFVTEHVECALCDGLNNNNVKSETRVMYNPTTMDNRVSGDADIGFDRFAKYPDIGRLSVSLKTRLTSCAHGVKAISAECNA